MSDGPVPKDSCRSKSKVLSLLPRYTCKHANKKTFWLMRSHSAKRIQKRILDLWDGHGQVSSTTGQPSNHYTLHSTALQWSNSSWASANEDVEKYTLELGNTYIQTLGLHETYMEFIRLFVITDLNRIAELTPGTTHLGFSIIFIRLPKIGEINVGEIRKCVSMNLNSL